MTSLEFKPAELVILCAAVRVYQQNVREFGSADHAADVDRLVQKVVAAYNAWRSEASNVVGCDPILLGLQLGEGG